MKPKIILSLLVLLTIAFTLTPNPCLSAVPSLINYQGVLKDSTGAPVTGDPAMEFSIWDDSIAGNLLWDETYVAVHVEKGLFNVLLGSKDSIPDSVFNAPDRWLQVQVGASVLCPRRQIVSVGYAFTDGDWTIDGENIYRLQGNVGIGTTGPNYKLEVAGTAYVSGIATFGSIPVLPASDPTADNEATRRKFVTDKFNTSTGHDHDGTNSKQLSASGMSAVLGAWVNKSSNYGAQQATTDGFVLLEAEATNPNYVYIKYVGYSDNNANPSTVRARTQLRGVPSMNVESCSFMFPVRKNDYWKIVRTVTEGSESDLSVYWIPLGS